MVLITLFMEKSMKYLVPLCPLCTNVVTDLGNYAYEYNSVLNIEGVINILMGFLASTKEESHALYWKCGQNP